MAATAPRFPHRPVVRRSETPPRLIEHRRGRVGVNADSPDRTNTSQMLIGSRLIAAGNAASPEISCTTGVAIQSGVFSGCDTHQHAAGPSCRTPPISLSPSDARPASPSARRWIGPDAVITEATTMEGVMRPRPVDLGGPVPRRGAGGITPRDVVVAARASSGGRACRRA